MAAIFANTHFHAKLPVRNSLVEMPFGLVNASFSLPEWRAVKILSLHPEHLNRSINILSHHAEKIGQKSCTKQKFKPKGPETLKSTLSLTGNQ